MCNRLAQNFCDDEPLYKMDGAGKDAKNHFNCFEKEQLNILMEQKEEESFKRPFTPVTEVREDWKVFRNPEKLTNKISK